MRWHRLMLRSHNYMLQRLILTFTAVLLFLPVATHAADVGLLQKCNDDDCSSNLECAEKVLYNKLTYGVYSPPGSKISNSTAVCLPIKETPTCGSLGSCSKKVDGSSVCATVQSLSDVNKIGVTCLKPTQEAPQNDTPSDNCKNTQDCSKYGTGSWQCVRVIVWDTTDFDEFVATQRCIPVEKLPGAVLDADKGSCGFNAKCGATESCVQNTFETSSQKSYVCYAKTYIGSAACAPVAGACTLNGKPGICINVSDANASLAPRCVDPVFLPNGPNANSTQLCKADSDCKAEAGYTFCLNNPVTKKNNCFAQKDIFTDMSKLPQQLCNGVPCPCIFLYKTGCEPTGQESICAAHMTKPPESVCIKYAGAGAALGTGAGTPTTDPSYIPPDVAAETFERYAPKLQIDIPTLSFTEKIIAQSGSGENKIFFVPYLAIYINAVYKYALGLGVLIAIITIMFAGFRWMSAFGNAKVIGESKTMIGNSVFGLFLLFSAFTILYVINPDLPQMKALQILTPKQEVFWVAENGNDEVTDGEPGETFTPTSITPGKLPEFKQCDPQWRNVPYPGNGLGTLTCSNGSVATICTNGCAVTSLAAVMVFHGLSVTPPDIAKYAAGVGAHPSCAGTAAAPLCSPLSNKFPSLKCTPLGGRNVSGIAEKLKQNKPVIFSCHGCSGTTVNGKIKTYKGHYMVLTGVDASGKNFSVIDVGNKGADRNVKLINIAEFEQGRIQNAYVVEPK